MIKYKGAALLEILEGADNYNAWIASELAPYIIEPALEIGAGTGSVSQYFKTLNSLTITDRDQGLVTILNKRFKSYPKVKTQIFNITQKKQSFSNKYNTIYAVNVLEHIENDLLALKNMYRLLNNKGRVVLLVPAKRRAFTHLDKMLGHFRRYEKDELQNKMENAGFLVESINYFNIVGLLSWMIRDKINSNAGILSPTQVKLFDFIVPILKIIESIAKPPAGISLIVVGRKI